MPYETARQTEIGKRAIRESPLQCLFKFPDKRKLYGKEKQRASARCSECQRTPKPSKQKISLVACTKPSPRGEGGKNLCFLTDVVENTCFASFLTDCVRMWFPHPHFLIHVHCSKPAPCFTKLSLPGGFPDARTVPWVVSDLLPPREWVWNLPASLLSSK